MIALGTHVRETHSGIEGVVTGRTEYLHRSALVLIAREGVQSNGATWDDVWFDEGRLTVVAP